MTCNIAQFFSQHLAQRQQILYRHFVDERWRDVIRDTVEHTALRRAHLVMCDITARSHLLELPAHRLDYVFPVRHEPLSCRVPARLPQWGGAAPAAAS